jgi:hypothetical protein
VSNHHVSKFIAYFSIVAVLIFFQNCSQVGFQESNSMSSKAGGLSANDLDLDDDGGITSPDGGKIGTINDIGNSNAWLAANCDPAQLKAAPASFNFTATGAAVRHQQLMQAALDINGSSDVRVQQAHLGSLKILKSGNVDVQQVHADKIEVEALNISKFQQVFAKEIFLRTALIDSGNLQQIGLANPNLFVEAFQIDGNVQQIKALCLATHSAKAIQQVLSAHVVGRASGNVKASIESVQQLHDIAIEDADVGVIQQVNEVVLRNVHVGKVQQVGKLTLINSTVDEIQQVGQVIK